MITSRSGEVIANSLHASGQDNPDLVASRQLWAWGSGAHRARKGAAWQAGERYAPCPCARVGMLFSRNSNSFTGTCFRIRGTIPIENTPRRLCERPQPSNTPGHRGFRFGTFLHEPAAHRGLGEERGRVGEAGEGKEGEEGEGAAATGGVA